MLIVCSATTTVSAGIYLCSEASGAGNSSKKNRKLTEIIWEFAVNKFCALYVKVRAPYFKTKVLTVVVVSIL
ncbi:hypothetical protein HNQ00_002677 [Flavobacterium sp. 14A]|nr:hypothetical protein [Flavobacterium sp. 14A]